MKGKEKPFYEDTFHILTSILEKIRFLNQPVIAQVDGLATAAGAQVGVLFSHLTLISIAQLLIGILACGRM